MDNPIQDISSGNDFSQALKTSPDPPPPPPPPISPATAQPFPQATTNLSVMETPTPAPAPTPPPVIPTPAAPVSLAATPTSLPPDEEVVPEPKEKISVNFLKRGGWIAGPIIMVLCLGWAFYNFSRLGKPEIAVQQPEWVELPSGKKITAKIKASWDAWLENIPKNPTAVEAKSSSESWAVNLESGQTYSYPRPIFAWSGAQTQEPNTEIVGYYVYFGEKSTTISIYEPGFLDTVDPQKMGQFQETNTFEAKDLEKGKTYYLFVQAVSNSQNQNYKVGYEVVDREKYQVIPANILFEYHYE